jgi:hypothetical protein
MSKRLREVLQAKCDHERLNYSSALPLIKEVARKLMTYTHGKFPYYTLHDFNHSEQVERNLDELIPDEVKHSLNAEEIYFLIVSAWLHDWGMIGQHDEEPESIRDNHHERTEEFFLERWAHIPELNHAQATYIGRISKGHRKVNLLDRDQYPLSRPAGGAAVIVSVQSQGRFPET